MTHEQLQQIRTIVYDAYCEGDTEAGALLVVIDAELAKPEQEPVAWMDEFGNTFPFRAKEYSPVGKYWKPLYTAPVPAPQREWVSLDSDDLLKLPSFDYDAPQFIAEKQFVQAVDAALKEKNHG